MKWIEWLAGLLLVGLAPVAFAQDYPSKPVRFVVGFTAGGATDIAARIVAQRLTESWGKSFVVDNRPGASGMIGAELVAKAPPDGYTMLVAPQTSQAVAVSLYPKIAYDPVRDFMPITVIASSPLLLAVHPSVPVKTVKELVALAKARPGQLTFGSGGAGTAPHMAGELMNMMTGVKTVHVPYKGEGPGARDLLAGQITFMMGTFPALLPHVRDGKLRGIAVTSLQRPPTVPDIPTAAESGLPGFDVAAWFGLFAPAGTPPEIVNRLHREVVRVVTQPEVKEKIAVQGLFVVANSPEEFAAFLKSEIARWAKVVKVSGATAQ